MRKLIQFILAYAAIVGLTLLVLNWTDQGPHRGESCYEKLQRLQRGTERYSGETEDVIDECRPERQPIGPSGY